MIYPIVAYGDPVLRKKTKKVTEENTNISKLVNDMFETMYEAGGVGLAAPQIGLNIRMFIVDAEPMDEENCKGFKKVFINPEKVEETGEEWTMEEGCLSIPGIREEVSRPDTITIKYLDEKLKEHTETFDGMSARVIQHEYDHIEGVLFTDYLTPLKRQLLKRKLMQISKGKVKHDYKMKFPNAKKGK